MNDLYDPITIIARADGTYRIDGLPDEELSLYQLKQFLDRMGTTSYEAALCLTLFKFKDARYVTFSAYGEFLDYGWRL